MSVPFASVSLVDEDARGGRSHPGEVELSAGTIEYEDTGGDGPVVVLLHGLAMSGTLWRNVVADLRADHRCVVPTLPLGAHRRPMRDDADLSLAGQARLVAELLERLDLRDVTLVGSDWGGAQLVAADHPERVGRLVLISVEAFENFPPGLPGRNLALACRLPGGLNVLVQGMRLRPLRRLPVAFGWMSKRPVPREVMDGWVAPIIGQKAIRRDVLKYVRSVRKDELLEVAERLRAFDRPALIVWAAEDRIMPPEHGRRLAELMPDARLVEVADSYTLVAEDQPAQLAAHLRAFVAGHATTPAQLP